MGPQPQAAERRGCQTPPLPTIVIPAQAGTQTHRARPERGQAPGLSAPVRESGSQPALG